MHFVECGDLCMGWVETPVSTYIIVFQPTPTDLYVAFNCETTGSASKAVRQLKMCRYKRLSITEQDAQLSQRDRAAGYVIVLAKSGILSSVLWKIFLPFCHNARV